MKMSRSIKTVIIVIILLLVGATLATFFYAPLKEKVFGTEKINEYPLSSVISSVVSIFCPIANDSGGQGLWGSGTIWDEDGTIYTNAHVIPKNGQKVLIPDSGCLVTLPDPTSGAPTDTFLAKPTNSLPSELESKYDFTELKIYDTYTDTTGRRHGTYPRSFPYYRPTDFIECPNMYSKDPVKLGDKIRILGYPGSSGNSSITITEGIVSNLPDDGETILTSAKIDAGNSGGLAIDSQGCPVGIPSAVHIGTYDTLGVVLKQFAFFRALGGYYEDILKNRNLNR